MWCLVKIPDGKTLAINCDAKAIGQECLEKVCQDLEILCEMDYFGLKTKNDDDEWINLRNPLFGQRSGDGTETLFVLGVKFWVPPELLLQNCVRNLFFMQARLDLLAGKLLPSNWKTAAVISALLAHGDQVKFNPTTLTARCPPCTATTLLTRKRNDTSNSECKKRKLSKDKYIEKLLITTTATTATTTTTTSNNSSQQQQQQRQMKSTPKSTQQPGQQQQQQQQQREGQQSAVAVLNKSKQLKIGSSSTTASTSTSTIMSTTNDEPTTKSSSSTIPPSITTGNVSNITTSPLNVYIDYILRPEGFIINDDTLPENYLQTIAIEHSKLIQLEMSSESAKYWLLENISKFSSFGVEMFYGINLINNMPCRIGVGPHGLSITMETVKRCVPFTDICRSSSLKNIFKLTYIDHENKLIELEIRFVNPINAKAIYRTLTEKHAFYSCETVRRVVQTQCQRNLKGTIVSMFKDTTTLGKRYVFDIQRTCREARDHAQRVLHSLGIEKTYTVNGAIQNGEQSLAMPKLTANYAELLKQQKNVKIQMEKIVADRIIESFTCRICMDRQFNAMFSPCGHIIACNSCAEKCEICPVCRSAIEKVNKVFLPTDRITPSEDISTLSPSPTTTTTTTTTQSTEISLLNPIDVEVAT